ncbi:Na+/H+ antiporter subunit E [Alcaligenaceae bacterium]|nr:Na+/H+ antiporter subunit E [Alcaligenaceae bacterium]
MSRLLKKLSLPALLLALWLLLNDSLSPGNLVLGAALAVLLAWLAAALRPLRAYPKRPLTALRLIWNVAVDITKSNIAVARIVWLGRRANATPGFIQIPIRMRDPHGLAALACIITYTPGTVWSDFAEADGQLTLHVLDLKDEAAWIELVQQRYERPLMEIFE